MSWSDDTRCLFCDGKLPLFRKLAQGQFCSKSHQEAYWKEQDQLAVQVLHRTHDAIQAYKISAPVESILGPAPGSQPALPVEAVRTADYTPVPERRLDFVPEIQELVRQSGLDRPISPPIWAVMATDPVEYELRPTASAPTSLLHQVTRSFDVLAGPLPLHGAQAAGPAPIALPAEASIADAQLVLSSPDWQHFCAAGLSLGGLVAWHEASPMAPDSSEDAAQALEFSIDPVRKPVHTLAPCGDVIESLEKEAFPLGETMLALTPPSVATGKLPAAQGTAEFDRFQLATVERPLATEAPTKPLALAAAAGMFDLPVTISARDWQSGIVGNPTCIEPRMAAVAMQQVRMSPALAADPMADLLAGSGCAPLVPLGMNEPSTGADNLATRPVSFQAFAPECAVHLPDSARRRVAAAILEIRVRAEQVLPVKLAEKIRPRADVRLRPGFVAAPLQGDALLPKSKLAPLAWKKPAAEIPVVDGAILNQQTSARSLASGVTNFWNNAPRDLKMLLFAVPLALGLAFAPSLPKVSLQSPGTGATDITGQFKNVVSTQMASLRKSIAERAAVGLDENFRQGLDNWMSHSGSTAEWSFDQAGFVQPGRVALYQPSLGLSDYEFQFLGAIDKGAISWVTRASDFDNCYVVKLVVLKGGPVPQMGITRYAVINGKAVDRVDTPVTFQSRTDSLYRVSMVMEGDHYSLVIQGQMIDSWNEPRLKRGGVGFFTNSGEKSRIGWVQITHQYDTLGRLFAYLAP